jgi:predicted 3-demethylubiquinone-9 3-methyltransferase (glyoxalase superfamily)
MRDISPFLWFDTHAEEAARLYASAFRDGKVGTIAAYPEGSPGQAGTVMTVAFELAGTRFVALNGGPAFSFTPAVSFHVDCATAEDLLELWNALSPGGKVLMELGEYPFSKRYGWFNDKYGVSWQLNLTGKPRRVAPFLLFTGGVVGKAEEAIAFYASAFDGDASVGAVQRYAEGEEDVPGRVKHAEFTLCGQSFHAMDSGLDHKFGFSTATSFAVNCDTQDEIDALWDALSAVPEAEQCGWLKDKYGVSWQVVPRDMETMMAGDTDGARRAMHAMLGMKKLDLAALRAAHAGA